MNIEYTPFVAYVGNLPYIFISYAHLDSEVVYPIIDQLHKSGYRIWYDQGIDPGDEWRDNIAESLEHSRCFMLFVSKNSIQSKNVRNEILYALNQGKDIISVFIEEARIPRNIKAILDCPKVDYADTEDIKKISALIEKDTKREDKEYTDGISSEHHPADSNWILHEKNYDNVFEKLINILNKSDLNEDEQNSKNAFDIALKLSESGFCDAQFYLAVMYAYSIGTKKDIEKFKKWIRIAKIQGHLDATLVYDNGFEISEQIKKRYFGLFRDK